MFISIGGPALPSSSVYEIDHSPTDKVPSESGRVFDSGLGEGMSSISKWPGLDSQGEVVGNRGKGPI